MIHSILHKVKLMKCSGLSRKCPQQFHCLNTQSPAGGVIWKQCGSFGKKCLWRVCTGYSGWALKVIVSSDLELCLCFLNE